MRFRVDGGRSEVYVNRTQSVLALVATAILLLGGIVLVVADPAMWEAWVGVAIFGVGGAVLVRRAARKGTLRGRPALVLDDTGLTDHRTGDAVRWPEVGAVRIVETVSGEGHVSRSLRLEPRDPDGDRVDVPLALLAVSHAELAQLVRRHWDGPVTGVEPVDLGTGRQSRGRRLARWTAGWAIPLGLGIGAVAAYRWLRGR
jgi:hypothetical protein